MFLAPCLHGHCPHEYYEVSSLKISCNICACAHAWEMALFAKLGKDHHSHM